MAVDRWLVLLRDTETHLAYWDAWNPDDGRPALAVATLQAWAAGTADQRAVAEADRHLLASIAVLTNSIPARDTAAYWRLQAAWSVACALTCVLAWITTARAAQYPSRTDLCAYAEMALRRAEREAETAFRCNVPPPTLPPNPGDGLIEGAA